MKRPFYQDTKVKILEELKIHKEQIERLQIAIEKVPDGEEDVIHAFLVEVAEKSMTNITYWVGVLNGCAMKKYELPREEKA